jgi:DNA-binding CsgD family transcriptional regulator
MSALNVAPAPFTGAGPDEAARREALLATVIERSWFVACVTDTEGIVQWATPAFCSLVAYDGDPVGRSLFTIANARAAKLAPVLATVLAAPMRQATADIDVGDLTAPHFMRVTAENLCSDPNVGGVLWSQQRDVAPERVERLTRTLMNIAREVEWVGFGRKRAKSAPAAPIGLLAGAEQLSDRERAVATMLAQGESVSAIAARLFVSPSTVRNYLSSMYRKLGVPDLAGLRELLARGGAVSPLRVVESMDR